jgi:pimeloyl-ACP methyl ester carboxylesterase
MPGYRTGLALVILAITLFQAWSAKAEEVKTQYQGLTLNANLELAKHKGYADGVILITHGLLQHNHLEIISETQALLKARGYSSLAINYSLAINDRHGLFDCMAPHHHVREATWEEIGIWVKWLKSKGARHIMLAGHSTGANEVAIYSGMHRDPEIKKVIMITPATADHNAWTPAGYRARYGKDLGEVLSRAQKLIDAGRGSEIMPNTDFLYCPAAPVSAATFASYYGVGASLRSLPTQLQRLNAPTLVIAAGADNIAPDMAAIVAPYIDGKRIKLVTIDNAGHFLRDLYLEDAVDAMIAFLTEK